MRNYIALTALVSWLVLLCCCGNGSKTSEPTLAAPEKAQAAAPESSAPVAASQEEPRQSRSVLMVIAPKDFRDEELFVTRKALEDAGCKITLGSTTTDEATGMLGGKAKPDISISSVKIDDYEAVVFVGGSGTKAILDDAAVLTLAKNAAGAGKLVAAICMAPEILANAGLLENKKATCWSGGLDSIKAKGALVVAKPVVTDGRIVTGSGPAAAKEFGEAIVEALKKGI